MALIKCTECGKEISNKAVACPHCGAPIIGENKKIAFAWNKKIVYSIVTIAVVLLAWSYLILQGSHYSVEGNMIGSISTIEKIMPESKNINAVKNGILPDYPQITVGKAIDGYAFFKRTEWSEFINENNEIIVAVKCILDQEKLGLYFQTERQEAMDKRGWGGSPNLCENNNNRCSVKVDNENITFYFLVNENSTFNYSRAEAGATVNGVEVKTDYGEISLNRIHWASLDLIYSNSLTRFYILPYSGLYWKYYHEVLEPKKNINNNYSFTQNSNIADSEYSELKKISPEYSSSEMKMIQTYSKLKKTLPNDAVGLLENDQNRWLNERNQGALNAGSKGSKEYLGELIRLTQERTKELSEQVASNK